MKPTLAATLAALAAALIGACVPAPKAAEFRADRSSSHTTALRGASARSTDSTSPRSPSNVPSLAITFLDVGQGDAALMTTSDRHAVLIDAGPPEGATRVARALEGIALDAVILSHAHADHLGDVATIARTLAIGQWVDPGFAPHTVAEYPRALAALRARGVPIARARRGDRIALGAAVDLHVLAPEEPLFEHTRSDINANSVVLRVDHHSPRGDVRILFEGDAESPTEQRLLADRPSLRADVLKVAHHGSRHASTPALLDAVSPRLAVISCATDNDYGHPHAETLARLAARRTTIARTDLEGDIRVISNDDGLTWTTERSASNDALRTPGTPSRREAP